MRTIIPAMLLLLCAFCPPAHALTESQQLTTSNMAAVSELSGMQFTVTAQAVGDKVRFVFTVKPGRVPLQGLKTGELTISDGTGEIATCPIEPGGVNGVSYTFDVAAKYLPGSRFIFTHSPEKLGEGWGPFHEVTWINLSDFAPPK